MVKYGYGSNENCLSFLVNYFYSCEEKNVM